MLRYTLRAPNQKSIVFHWFPITRAPKSGPGRVKLPWVNDPPTTVMPENCSPNEFYHRKRAWKHDIVQQQHPVSGSQAVISVLVHGKVQSVVSVF